jgi:hypothetical protein
MFTFILEIPQKYKELQKNVRCKFYRTPGYCIGSVLEYSGHGVRTMSLISRKEDKHSLDDFLVSHEKSDVTSCGIKCVSSQHSWRCPAEIHHKELAHIRSNLKMLQLKVRQLDSNDVSFISR